MRIATRCDAYLAVEAGHQPSYKWEKASLDMFLAKATSRHHLPHHESYIALHGAPVGKDRIDNMLGAWQLTWPRWPHLQVACCIIILILPWFSFWSEKGKRKPKTLKLNLLGITQYLAYFKVV